MFIKIGFASGRRGVNSFRRVTSGWKRICCSFAFEAMQFGTQQLCNFVPDSSRTAKDGQAPRQGWSCCELHNPSVPFSQGKVCSSPPKAPGFAFIFMIQNVPRKESFVLNLETFQEMVFCAKGHFYVAPKPIHGEQLH